MSYEISELVRETLRKEGCSDQLISAFDGHSTISLDFTTIPSILISQVEEATILWCRLDEHRLHVLEQCSARLLTLLMEPTAYSITGQFQLDEDQGYTILKLVPKPSVMNPTDFSDVLEEFYQTVEKFIEVMR